MEGKEDTTHDDHTCSHACNLEEEETQAKESQKFRIIFIHLQPESWPTVSRMGFWPLLTKGAEGPRGCLPVPSGRSVRAPY